MSESYSRTTRRYWRRTSDPQPWWPWGLLPFLGLVGAYLVGAMLMAPRIEAEIRSEVADTLDGSTFENSVLTDGQGVSVLATALESDRAHVEALAGATRCDTWAGEMTCPTTVDVDLIEPEPVSAATQAVEVQPVNTVDVMDVGSAGAVAIIAEPAPEPEQIVDRCNEQFEAILSQSSIRFQTSSANFDVASDDILRRLAVVAEDCPGTLRIEGHTDSRGDAEMNRALSEARANAVRSEIGRLGVDVSRIIAEGFGELQPVADNSTSTGRALNRRIVISVEQ